VLPEIDKAFRSQATRREDYRIACYDSAEEGGLPAHRDNPTPQTHHRLFTVSVHLNAGDYDGGGLCFREFGDQVYEVERGTAVVWSCTLLHEVAPVTRGRRFILGTHLFNNPPR
jgi:predicted 2-oxoglutarate/Fe(II)-dependent dioxygenase YbiX